jgi:5-methylcytosine-specific restriction enzyme A
MKHWIFIANDNQWDWRTCQEVGVDDTWPAKGKKIPQKIYSEIEPGDKVIGYSSGKAASFVSIAEVIDKSPSQDLDEQKITIRKTCDLQTPVNIGRVRQIKPFDSKFDNGLKLRKTVVPLTVDEYNILMSLFYDAFLDIYDTVDSDLNSVDMPIKKALELRQAKQTSNSTAWIRDSNISKAALKRADYTCELATDSDSHDSFIAHCTKKNYVEAHHLIPMKEQENFKYSLDNALNIVALCPNCHKMIHYADKAVRKIIITEIFEKRKNDLDAYKITLSDLCRIYNV